jgi:hypothetical protein
VCSSDLFMAQVRRCRARLERPRPPPLPGGPSNDDPGPANNDPGPVFFVGFPRSGTTLMEQALAAHPRLRTTGEDSPLTAVVERIGGPGGFAYPDALDTLTPSDAEALRALFWRTAESRFGRLDGAVLVDKLPLNIVHVGLVEALFPTARIVVALRDPRDSCLSCFIQKFHLNDAMANFLDIDKVGAAYAAIMGLWLKQRESLVTPWREYRYEDLVLDFPGTVRGVLDFIGVGWDDAVAGYRERSKERVVSTPSYRDVTAPVHGRAVERWRAYADDLAPILPVLQPFVTAFGYD